MSDCRNHPGVLAVGRCAGCAEEFCHNCLVEVQGQNYCGACKSLVLQGKVPEAAVDAATMPCPQAKTALILSIVSLFCFGFIIGPIAIYQANKAKQAIAADPRLSGAGQATAALVIGIIGTVGGVLVTIWNVNRLSHQ